MSKLPNNPERSRLLIISSDYASVVLVVMLIIGVANWFAYARSHYHGPRLEM